MDRDTKRAEISSTSAIVFGAMSCSQSAAAPSGRAVGVHSSCLLLRIGEERSVEGALDSKRIGVDLDRGDKVWERWLGWWIALRLDHRDHHHEHPTNQHHRRCLRLSERH